MKYLEGTVPSYLPVLILCAYRVVLPVEVPTGRYLVPRRYLGTQKVQYREGACTGTRYLGRRYLHIPRYRY